MPPWPAAIRGEREQAVRAYQAARDVVDRVVAGLADEPLRASLVRLPLVEEIRRGAAPLTLPLP